eukprot:COSAG06_NODE_40979_length_396_cov_1.037037_1_plen_106_part_10
MVDYSKWDNLSDSEEEGRGEEMPRLLGDSGHQPPAADTMTSTELKMLKSEISKMTPEQITQCQQMTVEPNMMKQALAILANTDASQISTAMASPAGARLMGPVDAV